MNRLLRVVAPALSQQCSGESEVREAWRELLSRLFALRMWRRTVELPIVQSYFRDTAATLRKRSAHDPWMWSAMVNMQSDVKDAARERDGLFRPHDNCVQLARKQMVADLGHHKATAYHTCLRLARYRPGFFARTFLAQLDCILRDKAFGVRARVFMNRKYPRLFFRALLVLDQLGPALFEATEWSNLLCTMLSVMHTFADHCANSYSAVPATIRAFVCKLVNMMGAFAARDIERARQLLLRPSIKAVLLMWAWPPAGVGSREDPPPHPNDTKQLRAEAWGIYMTLQSLIHMLEQGNIVRDPNMTFGPLARTQVSVLLLTKPSPMEITEKDLAATRLLLIGPHDKVALSCLDNLRTLAQYRPGIALLYSDQLIALASRPHNAAVVPGLLRLCVAAMSAANKSYLSAPAGLEAFCCRLFSRAVRACPPQHHTLALQSAQDMFVYVSAEYKFKIAVWLFRCGNYRGRGKSRGQSGIDVLRSILKPN